MKPATVSKLPKRFQACRCFENIGEFTIPRSYQSSSSQPVTYQTYTQRISFVENYWRTFTSALLVKRDTWIKKRCKELAKVDCCTFLVGYDPYFPQKNIGWKFVQNYSKCTKKVEAGLVRGWKKLKIAMLNEASFMVKLRFEKCKYCFANICALVTWVKYLQHSRGFNSSL